VADLKPLRIATLDVAAGQQARLARLLDFPHEFAVSAAHLQEVDAVVALRFGAPEAAVWKPRLLHLPGAGADAVRFDVLPPHCVVCNVFEHEIPVAEYIFSAILEHALGYAALRRAFDGERWAASYAARRPHGEVHGKTLGLIGYGHIGRELARRARAFGMQVHAISHSGHAPEADWAGRADQLRAMLPRVDFLVIACPLTNATRGMLGAAEFELIKSGAVLINIGRAQVADEEALFRALESGRLAGATLDVWYEYPAQGRDDVQPARFPFWSLPSVHCTAHSCAWTDALFARRYAVIADNLSRLYHSLPLRNTISGDINIASWRHLAIDVAIQAK
jgi:phosphoglycerate dehydrogenase-like enzyme